MPYYAKQNGNIILKVGKNNSDKYCYVIKKSGSEEQKTTLDLIKKGDVFRCIEGDETDVFEGYEDCLAEESAEVDYSYGLDMTYVKVKPFSKD